jgi:hypothetical protein
LTVISDKFRARCYVSERLGRSYVVPLLWDGERPEDIPFDRLPNRFVIKMNHGCGFNIVVRDKTRLDRTKAALLLKRWSAQNFCSDKYLGIAWAYRNITPRIVIEAFLDDNGQIPVDYKFFCFSGCVEFWKVDVARFENHATKFFDRGLNALDLVEVGFRQYDGDVAVPDNFDEMVRIAETLANGWDFIRVDLYNLSGKIYCGELTPYPGGVSQRFHPDSYDRVFGSKWKWE